MEWLTGLALLPALVCGVMMGGMTFGAAFGLRRKGDTATSAASQSERGANELEGVAR